MAYAPIALTIPQYEDYPNYWLKAYEQGTVTPLVMATDATGGTTVAKFELDAQGFPKTAGNARLIPFIDGDYDLWLFPTAAEADANDTTNAIQFADNLNTDPGTDADTLRTDLASTDITKGAALIGNAIQIVTDMASLRAITPVTTRDCYISGHTIENDGGQGQFYAVTGAAPATYVHNNGTIVVPSGGDGSAAWLRHEPGNYTFFEWFGTVHDGTTDDITAINATIDYVADSNGGTILGAKAVYGISSPILTKKGVRILGTGQMNIDGCTEFFLLANSDDRMFQTPSALARDDSGATHYMAIENLLFNGNRDNQTQAAEFTAVEFWGALVTCSIRNVFIRDVYGPGLTLDVSSDLEINNVWINICATDEYAFSVNAERVRLAGSQQGVLSINNLYVENTASLAGYAAGGSATELRNNPSRRGNGVLFEEVVILNAGLIHTESCHNAISIDGGQILNFGSMDCIFTGDDTDGSVLRIINSKPYSVQTAGIRMATPATGATLIDGSAFPDEYPSVDGSTNFCGLYRGVDAARDNKAVTSLGGILHYGRKITKRTLVTATPYTVVDDDYLIEIAVNSATINLPAASAVAGRDIRITNRQATTQTVTADGSDTIEPTGTTSYTIPAKSSVTLWSNGATIWFEL